jgi:folate-binding Fe-S cluster repair protein YgfZ
MAVQIASIPIHTLEPGEHVKTLYLNRTGSVLKDFNDYEEGVWYRAHQDKIVALEAVIETEEGMNFVECSYVKRRANGALNMLIN